MAGIVTALMSQLVAIAALILGTLITYKIIDTLTSLYRVTLDTYKGQEQSATQLAAALGAFTGPLGVIVGVFTGIVAAVFAYNQGSSGKQQAQLAAEDATKTADQAKKAVQELEPLAEQDQAATANALNEIRQRYPRAFGR